MKAMQKMQRIEAIQKRLYGLDCGSCGAPSCRALAEDIVNGYADEDACIYILKKKVETVRDSLLKLKIGDRDKTDEKDGCAR